MRYALLLVLGIALLSAGCTGSQPAAPAIACADYCPSLQHANCTGSWTASGTYPSCSCTYSCPPAGPPSNPGPPANNTPPPANTSPSQNVSPPLNQTPPVANTSGPVQPSVPVTDKSVATLLTDALASARMRFYSGNSGSFQESKYIWVRTPAKASPGELQVTYPATDVKFNGAAISSIEASGFIAFTNVDTDTTAAVGIAIFRADGTPPDAMAVGFSVDYAEPVINKNLRHCSVYDTLRQAAQDGTPILTYYFMCDEAVDK